MEDEIIFMSYSWSSHVVGDPISVTLSLKLVANPISQTGKLFISLPENFMEKIENSNFEVWLGNTNSILASSIT